MPRRRTAAGAPNQGAARADATWRPVRVVRLDVDTRTIDGDAAGPEVDVVWLEAVRKGRVVGLFEARPEGGKLSEAFLDDVLDGLDLTSIVDDPPVADARLLSATVVVPTILGRPDQLARTVASLDAMDYPEFDIVVVDNRRGTPSTPAPDFTRHPRVRVVAEPVPGISSARNRGVSQSTGAFVAFTDDDAVVEPGWLRALGSRFANEPDVDAIGGLVLPSELDTEPQLWFEEFYGGFSQSFRRSSASIGRTREADPLFPYAPGRFGAGCNMALRRDALERLGGFDVRLGTGTPARGGEDLAIFIALLEDGGTAGFEPSAVVRHSHRRTEEEFLHQVRAYGTGLSAMYTALVVRRPSTLFSLARRVPAGVRLLTRPRDERSPSVEPSYPRRALAYQFVGIALGPIAYARSWATARRAAKKYS